jgi:hypothetical protein
LYSISSGPPNRSRTIALAPAMNSRAAASIAASV